MKNQKSTVFRINNPLPVSENDLLQRLHIDQNNQQTFPDVVFFECNEFADCMKIQRVVNMYIEILKRIDLELYEPIIVSISTVQVEQRDTYIEFFNRAGIPSIILDYETYIYEVNRS